MTLYVIECTVDGTDEVRYIRHDPDCGYLLEATSLASATMFNTAREATRVFMEITQERPAVYTDGTIYPPHNISRGLGICNARPLASGTLSILPVMLGLPGAARHIEGEIKRPVGYRY